MSINRGVTGNHRQLTATAVRLYKEGLKIPEIAGLLYGDTSRKAQIRVLVLLTKARKKGLLREYRRPRRPREEAGVEIVRDYWRPEAYPRAGFELMGSSGPRSFGFMSESEQRRVRLSAVVADVAGSSGVKEYYAMYSLAQEVCSFIARKYEVSDAAAVGCVLTAVLAFAPQNRGLVERVLAWLDALGLD